MASLQKIALYIFFDSVESDLIQNIRKFTPENREKLLTPQEREKAIDNLSRRESSHNLEDELELLKGLDLGEKYSILMRLKDMMVNDARQHFSNIKKHFDQCVSVRNTVMHGRPLTIDEYSKAFALTSELIKYPVYWPKLTEVHKRYSKDPNSITEAAIQYLDDFGFSDTFHNLPLPDYEDTGFFPRKKLEAELKKKILGRHPVVTVLGDGGDGKTAVTLQTLYGLLSSNDHDFDAIIWVSAKSSRLTASEIERIETEITNSMAVFGEIAGLFEENSGDPMERVLALMGENKILLVIDNLETIIDKKIKKFAEDIPGESKLVLTSRIPLGSDLAVHVDPFGDSEAISFLRVLTSTYNIKPLKKAGDEELKHFATRLHNKPLLLKWFALGVLSGLNPSTIVRNPQKALKFCLENVFDALSAQTKRHLSALVSLPRAASIAVLEHVTEDDVLLLEASLAELMRFAIVEQVSETKYETAFQIKPLAKAYLVRVLKASSRDSEEILKRYRQIEGIYQNERGAKAHNRYNPNHYTVRSKSEALAVKKLKTAVHLGRQDDFLKSFSIIDDLKVTHPDYFEVNRVEAYMASLSGDNARAQDAYISAIEIGEKQPQVHLLYGGFLLRKFGDYEAALEQFQNAIELDGESSTSYIEATRASLYLFDFEGAQKYLDKARVHAPADQKTQCILCDMQVQIHWRRMEHSLRQGELNAACGSIDSLATFLQGIGFDSIDSVLIERLKKYLGTIPSIGSKLNDDSNIKLEKLTSQLKDLLALSGISERKVGEGVDNYGLTKVGELKKAGLQSSYGFLVDLEGAETFVYRGSTETEVWNAMLRGVKVRYEIETDSDGRTRAGNVALA
ncbi:tetratricopeptide repeat protein [Ruegeria lacuscaerulensis]|uniref:tetratricopeptide repeat protein n=1 Tax=Ruegeria lacuscaerulensis TaxID=55218 RepID=UPI00147A5476|nr:NB-ARC domain-containing protein [Ruegeria lacuscaerulensis]